MGRLEVRVLLLSPKAPFVGAFFNWSKISDKNKETNMGIYMEISIKSYENIKSYDINIYKE